MLACRNFVSFHLNPYQVISKTVSVQFSHSVMSNSLQPHGPRHARPPVHHQLQEFTQTHVYWVSDAIQPSLPLSSPSPPAFYLSQHQGLFQWVSSSQQVAKVLGALASASVLPMDIQDWFPLGLTHLISLCKGLSRVLSNITVKSIYSSTLSIFYGPTLTIIHDCWKNHSFD